jgi:hypothetical protein
LSGWAKAGAAAKTISAAVPSSGEIATPVMVEIVFA